MADRSDTFLREVDEELRRDQITRIFERYGVHMLVAAALILVGIGGTKWWQYRAQTLAETTGTRFQAATQLAKSDKADEALAAMTAIVADGGDGYRTLARLHAAGTLATKGKAADAIGYYEALIADAGADALLRDYARIQVAMIRLETADWTETENRLSPVVNGNSPWRSAAREVRALAALKAGKTDIARQELEGLLADRTVPTSLGERVQLLLAVMTDQDATAPKPDTGSSTAPATEKGPPSTTKQ